MSTPDLNNNSTKLKICVLQPDYSTSDVDYQNYDPARDLSHLMPEACFDHVLLNKLTTYKQLKELKKKNYHIFVNLCEGYLEWEIPSIDVIYSAELLDIPFVTICSALPFNQEPAIPPLFTTWIYSPAWWAALRNQLVYLLVNPFAQPMKKLRSSYRTLWQLPPETSCDSQLAIVTQQPAEFEYPRQNLPEYFHFTGPYHNKTSRKPVDFPWDKLNGQPLIYASMGTLQNQLNDVFVAIATACVDLDAQLVISLGGASLESLPELPGNPIVVSYAPQLALLERASVAITHAGMNTALECLTYGVPMVAIPITNDQPGVAARVAWTGAGEIVPLNKLTAARLETALKLVLTKESYRQNALRLKQSISQSGGASRAADIIELAISTRQSVNRV